MLHCYKECSAISEAVSVRSNTNVKKQPYSVVIVSRLVIFRFCLHLQCPTSKLSSMSNQFEFENAIRETARMDTSLSRAAFNMPRKALEGNTSLNISVGEFLFLVTMQHCEIIFNQECARKSFYWFCETVHWLQDRRFSSSSCYGRRS